MQKSLGFLEQAERAVALEESERLEESRKLLARLRRTVSSVSPEDLRKVSELNILYDALKILEGVSQKSIFNRLPKPVLEKVLVCLTATDLARCSGVSKDWRILASRIAKRRYLNIRQKRKVDKSFYPNWEIDPTPDSVTWITQLRAKEIEYSVVRPYEITAPMLQLPAVVSLYPIPIEVIGCGYAEVNGLYYNTSFSHNGLIFSKRLSNQRTCFIRKLYSGQISWWYLSLLDQYGACTQICHARLSSQPAYTEALATIPFTSWECFAEDDYPPPTIRLRRDLCLKDGHQTFLGGLKRDLPDQKSDALE